MSVSRPYRDEFDHGKVMSFLRDTYVETGGFENWLPPRFENNSREMDSWIRVWELDGGIVGLVVPEKPFQFFIQLHPRYQYLYDEMVKWIEGHFSSMGDEGVKLSIIELEGRPAREDALSRRGFNKEGIYGIFRLRNVDAPIPDYKIPDGFSIRSVTPDDFDEMAFCIRQVFGHGEWFNREILEKLARASFYNPDLDIVAVNKVGKIVSFCTFRVDPTSRTTELEPMGTLSEYRGKDIGRALLCEGFRRLKKYDPTLLYIGGAANNPAANRLYELTGFTQRIDMYRWVKLI